jgi:hypothetical protein
MLNTDKGTEFTNQKFQSMLLEEGIHWYSTENPDIKASLVERFNRTIKQRIYRYLTYKNTYRYVDVLPDLVQAYNRSWHRSIGMAPADVGPEDEKRLAARLYPLKDKKIKPKWKFEIGDQVRITTERQTFRKGYEGKNWSEEIFTVTSRHPTVPVTYGISDYADNPIKGRFYNQELQKVTRPELYEVERILRTRKRGNKTQYLVKFKGYPDYMNDWIDELHKL